MQISLSYSYIFVGPLQPEWPHAKTTENIWSHYFHGPIRNGYIGNSWVSIASSAKAYL